MRECASGGLKMTELPFLAGIGPINRDVEAKRDTIENALIAIDRRVRDTGFEISLTSDMDLFARTLVSVGKFLPNAFDRANKPFRPSDAVAVLVRDADGIAATYGIRLYRFAVTTLADHLATLSLFYANPAEQMARGERFFISGEADAFASKIEDSASYSGGMWIRPDLRGKTDFALIVNLIGGLLTQVRWGPQVTFSIVERALVTKGVVSSKYRSPHVLDTVRWFRPAHPDRTEMVLVAKTPDVVFEHANRFVAEPERVSAKAERPALRG